LENLSFVLWCLRNLPSSALTLDLRPDVILNFRPDSADEAHRAGHARAVALAKFGGDGKHRKLRREESRDIVFCQGTAAKNWTAGPFSPAARSVAAGRWLFRGLGALFGQLASLDPALNAGREVFHICVAELLGFGGGCLIERALFANLDANPSIFLRDGTGRALVCAFKRSFLSLLGTSFDDPFERPHVTNHG
jgi:hypothetical protein